MPASRRGGTRRERPIVAGDDWNVLRRFSSAVWVFVGIGTGSVAAAQSVLQSGATARLLLSAAYCFASALLVRVMPRRVLSFDLVLRLVGVAILYENVRLDIAAAYWIWFLPMFLTAIILPALFYRAVPLTLSAGSIVLATALLAAGTDGPASLRITVWAGFNTVMALIIIVIQRLATERRRTIEQLERLASTDALTGLANRRHFMAAASDMLARAHAEHRPCTLVIADVDHFKAVNDAYGHDVGDQVLLGVARALRDAHRTEDLVARLGGEEFAVLMVGASAMHAQHTTALATRSMRAVHPVGVTASYGVVEAKLGELAVGELLLRADTALYQAKRDGRDRCVVAT